MWLFNAPAAPVYGLTDGVGRCRELFDLLLTTASLPGIQPAMHRVLVRLVWLELRISVRIRFRFSVSDRVDT